MLTMKYLIVARVDNGQSHQPRHFAYTSKNWSPNAVRIKKKSQIENKICIAADRNQMLTNWFNRIIHDQTVGQYWQNGSKSNLECFMEAKMLLKPK